MTGATTSRNSSISSAASIDWTSRALPWIWSSRPGCSLSSATWASTSAERIVVGFQEPVVKVCEATYFGRLFMSTVKGSFGSVICGQSLAKAS